MFIRSSRGDEISLGQSKRETVRNISPSKWLPAQDRTWPTHPNVCLIFRQNYRPFPPLPRSLLCHRFERNRCIVEYGDGRIGYDKGWKKRRVCLFYKRHVLERGEDGGDDKNMGGKYRWNTSATPPTCFANSTFSSSILFPWISSEELNASLSKD